MNGLARQIGRENGHNQLQHLIRSGLDEGRTVAANGQDDLIGRRILAVAGVQAQDIVAVLTEPRAGDRLVGVVEFDLAGTAD